MSKVYYDARKHYDGRFKRELRAMALPAGARSPRAVNAWSRRARAKFAEIIGLNKMTPVAPKAKCDGSVDCGDYVREHWLMQTERDIIMPFYVLKPKAVKPPYSAIICPHGHGSGGKLCPAGVKEFSPEIAKSIVDHNYDYGVQAARAGLLAFCPDARGFGERQEVEMRDNILDSSCRLLQMMAIPLGISVQGMWTFDLMRLADYILSRRDVMPGRLGCAGLSGGGLQTLAFSAIDTRVTCSVISGYFYGARESLLNMPGCCLCNMVPHLWENLDMGDVGALIAPRPLLIETGDEDGLNGVSNVKNVLPQVATTRQAYKAFGAADHLYHDIFHGPHKWHGVNAIPWLAKWLK